MAKDINKGIAPHSEDNPDAALGGQRRVSRRQVLKYATALAGIVAVPGLSLDMVRYRLADAAVPTTSMDKSTTHQWAMVLDLRKCDGCKACTMACQQRHYLPPEQTWIDVFAMTDVTGSTYHMPRPCQMCENPPCVSVCPVGANIRNDEGLVLVDQQRCIGTRICMAACPYSARYFNWKEPPPAPRMSMPPSPEWPVPQQKGTVGKCVWCADRLPHGELPACVSGCPMGVIYIGDLVTDAATNGQGNVVKLSTFLYDNDAVRFKDYLGTKPRCYYILGHGQLLDGND